MISRATIALGLALIGLCGCASPEAIRAQEASARAAMEAQDDAKCRSFGASPGSQAYFDCRMSIDRQRQDATMQAAVIQQQNSQALTNAGIAIMNGR